MHLSRCKKIVSWLCKALFFLTKIFQSLFSILKKRGKKIWKKRGKKIWKKKGKIVTLFIVILVGAIITITGPIIYSNITANKNSEMMNNRPKPMSNDSQMLSGNGIPNNGQMPNDKTNQ